MISPFKRFDLFLQPVMVITLEAKLVFPGEGAVEIEDILLVTRAGCEPLIFTGKGAIVVAGTESLPP